MISKVRTQSTQEFFRRLAKMKNVECLLPHKTVIHIKETFRSETSVPSSLA